jgi:hypothetical protein
MLARPATLLFETKRWTAQPVSGALPCAIQSNP